MKGILILILIFNSGWNLFSQSRNDYFYTGNQKFERKEFNQAILDYSTAIELRPDFEPAWLNRASAKIQLGDYKSAMQDLNVIIKMNGRAYEAYCFRGIIKIKWNHCLEAIDDFNKALKINSKYAEAYYYRGICNGFLRDTTQARLDFETASAMGYHEVK